MGELLKEMEKNPGTRTGGAGGSIVKPPDDIDTLADLGISKTQSFRYQLLTYLVEVA